MRTKINDRNWAVTMGRINNFFKKPVKEYVGPGLVRVGVRNIYDENGNFICQFPEYEEQEIFKAYPGRCEKHFLYQEYLDKRKQGLSVNIKDTLGTRIALSTPHIVSCIPIGIGDTVELSSDKLVIKHHYYKDFSTRIFLHMETTKEELVEEIKKGILDSLLWFLDDTIWFGWVNDEFDSDSITILQAETEINNMIVNFVSDLDFENGSGIMSKEFYCNDLDTFVYNDDVKFIFSIDMDAAIKGDYGDDIFKIILDGNEVTNYEIIQKLFHRKENCTEEE